MHHNALATKVLLGLSVLGLSLPVHSVDPEPVTTLPRFVVTGFKSPKSIDDLGYQVRVIDRSEIESLPATKFSDVLNQASNLQLVTTGGLSGLFFKGNESNNYKIYVDGIELHDVSSPQGTPAVDLIPVGNIERIEILSGQGSVLHGTSAVGGVIQIFTNKGRKGGQFSQTSATDFSNLSVNYAGTINEINYSINYVREYDNRISAASAGSERDEQDKENIGFNISKAGKNYRASLSTTQFNSSTDYDEWNSDSTANAEIQNFRWKANLDYQHSENWESFISYSNSSLERDNRDNNPLKTTGLVKQFNAETKLSNLPYNLTTRIGYSVREEESERSDASPSHIEEQDSNALYLQAESINDIVSFRLGTRQESFKTDDASTYTLSFFKEIPVLGTLSLTKRTGYRTPTLWEINASSNGTELQAEESEVQEIGLYKELNANTSFGITFYDNNITNTLESAGWPNTYYYNQVGKANVKGLDYSLTIRNIGPFQHINLNYTDTISAEKLDGSPFARRPDNKFTASTGIKVDDQLHLGISIISVGDRYEWYNGSTQPFGNYTIANTQFTYDLSETSKLSLIIENFFDKDYEVVPGYETPGRTAFIRYSQTF